MDKTIRKNEICVIGLPRCDFAFSSTRSCFIAYGFDESTLEMTILRNILEKRSIQSIEAGGSSAPGQNAFCAKICSKIITSQFCIALVNNSEENNIEIPSANVNMEYGLMLGFNKYVIPFQRESQKLPFNIAGLDTIKYNDRDFEHKAIEAVDLAIKETTQNEVESGISNQILQMYLLSNNLLVSPIDNEGERAFYQLGEPLEFNLLVDFTGFKYTFLGQYSALRTEAVIWRMRKLNEIIIGRLSTFDYRVSIGLMTPEQIEPAKKIIENLEMMVIVTSSQDKEVVDSELRKNPIKIKFKIVTIEEVNNTI